VKAHAPGQLPTAGFAGISHQSEREFDGTVVLPESALCEHPPSLPEANRTRQMHLDNYGGSSNHQLRDAELFVAMLII
jgi:hypothetical protein